MCSEKMIYLVNRRDDGRTLQEDGITDAPGAKAPRNVRRSVVVRCSLGFWKLSAQRSAASCRHARLTRIVASSECQEVSPTPIPHLAGLGLLLACHSGIILIRDSAMIESPSVELQGLKQYRRHGKADGALQMFA